MPELESKKTLVITPADIVELPERPRPPVPDHELIRRIGGGAYGDVWLARNVVGTYRAIKVVYRNSFKNSSPYEREYHGIQKFEPISRSNDGFVDILQIGRSEEQGHFYYVMELADDSNPEGGTRNAESSLTRPSASAEASAKSDTLSHPTQAEPEAPLRRVGEGRGEGRLSQPSTQDPLNYVPRTLRSEVKHRGRLPFAECLQFAMSLNLALGHLHRHGLIHRDIKPSNIIFIGGIPKLADIGLVTEVEEARSFVGTEGFIPPEGPNSPQADIYSLGKVLYEMSMGKDRLDFPEPFTALGQATGSRDLEELNTVIVKACATNPRDRYQTAEEMHVDLALLQSGKSVKSKHMLERRLAVARKAGAVVGAVAVIAVTAYLYQQFQTREARRLAQENRQLASKEAAERQRAEGLLNTLELKQAENFFENDEAGKGVAYLARMLRQNPTNRIAAARLMSALTDRSFALPIRVFEHAENLHDVEFSPDGSRILTRTADDAAGAARIWDIRTGELVGKPMRHDRAVLAARFSPDGRYVVTASRDGSARLWDARTAEPVTPPLLHEKLPGGEQPEVRHAEFSSDGKTILTVSGSKARVWKVPTGEPVMSIDHGSTLTSAQFSPDGQRILTTALDHMTKIWDTSTGKPQFVVRTDKNATSGSGKGAGRFSPDGSRIAAAGGHDVYVWSANTGDLLHQLHHEGDVLSVGFSPDGLRIATGDESRSARVWDAQTGQLLLPPLTQKDAVEDLRFDPTGERLLTREFRRARIWDSRTGRPLTEWLVGIQESRFSPDGLQLLATTADDKLAILWEVRSGQALNIVLRHQIAVSTVKFNRDGDKVVSAAGGALVFRSVRGPGSGAAVWDARTGELLAPRINTSSLGVDYVEFSPDGRRMVTASQNNQARIWDARTGAQVTEPLRHGDDVYRARFSPDGLKVVTASKDKTARVWDAQTGRPLTDPLEHTNGVWSAEFSPDGRWVLTVPLYGTARIWDAHTGQLRQPELSLGKGVTDARFSPDGKRIVTTSVDGTARLWDSQTGEAVGEPMKHQDQGSVWSARFSPDGRLVVTASEDQSARVWDALTGKPVTEPLMHKGYVFSAQFSGDGQRVVTASADGTARVWDAKTGRPLTEPLPHNNWVAYAEFSPDGNWVITASYDGTARIWELAPADVPVPASVLELAEAVVGQRLTDQEVPEPISPIQFLALKKRLSEAPGTDRYTSWAKWLLADRLARNTSLSSSVTGSKHLDRLIRENSLTALREALHLAPDHALATARLPRQLLTQDVRRHPHKAKESELLSERALKLSPEEPEAWRAKAEVLEHTGRPEQALDAIGRAVALDEDDPLLWHAKGQLLEKAQRDADALQAYSKAVALASAAIQNLSDNSVSGSTGHWPVAPGDSPGGTTTAFQANQDAPFRAASSVAPVGGSPGGTGESPVAPILQTGSQDNAKVLETVLLARARLLKRLGRDKEFAADNLRARGIPPRDPQAKPALIDLSSHYNLSLLEDVVGWPLIRMGKDNLATLPQGVQVLGGIEYDIRGVVRVGWIGEPGNQVKEVAGFRVDQVCRQLHFLHAADGFGKASFANYTVEYMDGQREVIPIELNKNIGSLWQPGENDGDAEVVWRGINEASLEVGQHIRLFKLSWPNPRPEAPIRSIHLEYLRLADVRGLHEVIFLVAITAQSEPTPAITRQPQPQAVVEGESVVFRVEAESERPLAYQWQFNGTDVLGATNATLSFKAVTRENVGAYTVQVRNALEDSLLTLTSDPVPLVVKAGGLSYGALRREMFTNISGLKLSALTNHTRFPNSPDTRDFVHQFETPTDTAENYGVRVTGYLVPPKTGEYRFYLCADDEGAFFLSTNESPEQKRQIAHEPTGYGTGNARRLWTVSHSRPKQQNISEAIHLEAGRRYYIEALMKEGHGGDNLAVTWQLPGEPPPENLSPPIPGTYLAFPVSESGENATASASTEK